MQAALVFRPGEESPDLFGLPMALRAAISLAEAGATSIVWCAQTAPSMSPASSAADGGGELPPWAHDPRLKVPIAVGVPTAGRCLVLRTDALVAVRVLVELGVGNAVDDTDGTRLCGNLTLGAHDDLASVLAAAEAVALAPARDRFAMRVHDAASIAFARTLLFDALIKPSDGPVSRHFNRYISRAITRLVLPLGMTPNVMTVFVAISGLLAAYFASSPRSGYQALGAVLYQFHSIIDGCDGEIARLTKRFGKHGALIDSLVDDICNLLFFVGLPIGVARAHESHWPLYGAAITAFAYVGVIVIQYGVVLRDTGRGDKTKFWESSERLTLFGIAKLLLRRDVFVLGICFLVACGAAPLAVAIFPFAALGTLIASAQRLRALGSSDRGVS